MRWLYSKYCSIQYIVLQLVKVIGDAHMPSGEGILTTLRFISSIQVKNVQAKIRVKSKKRKKCRKFSGKIGGKFPEIFHKISNFSAEIFRLTSLAAAARLKRV